jgi:hypothetical protein
MRIDSSGNVGIGTSSPSTKLEVRISSDGSVATFRRDSGTVNPGLRIVANETGSTVGFDTAYSTSSPDYTFSIGGTQVMRLTSSGNLGLGVTPSAWRSTTKAIEGPAGSLFSFSTTAIGVVQNAYLDSVGWKYKATAAASNYEQASGAHLWSIAASGTAGNAITFTQAMTLNASGNLGIGTTSPSQRLSIFNSNGVYGTAYQPAMILCIDSSGGTVTANTGLGAIVWATDTLGIPVASVEAIRENPSVGAASSLVLRTGSSGGGTERMRITSNGRILVGTTDPGDTSGVGIKMYSGFVDSTDPSIRFVGNTTDSNKYPLMVRSISNNTWRFYMDYAGNLYAQNTSITSLSDARLKENVRDLETGLSEVMALKPRRFDWKEGQGQDKKDVAGFIAQEVEPILPEMVSTGLNEDENGEKYKTLAPAMLIPTLVKAIQEQQAIINDLKARIETLESK